MLAIGGSGSLSSNIEPRQRAEADRLGDDDEDRLQSEEEEAPDDADEEAGEDFGDDQANRVRKAATAQHGERIPDQERRQGERHPSATKRRTCGGICDWAKPGHHHEAGPDPAEDQERRDQTVVVDRDHEMVPSALISTPRAISTCESTGNEGNIRSMIIRT